MAESKVLTMTVTCQKDTGAHRNKLTDIENRFMVTKISVVAQGKESACNAGDAGDLGSITG